VAGFAFALLRIGRNDFVAGVIGRIFSGVTIPRDDTSRPAHETQPEEELSFDEAKGFPEALPALHVRHHGPGRD
jgi:hypothetical protein